MTTTTKNKKPGKKTTKSTPTRPINQIELTYLCDTFAKVFPRIKRDGLSKKAALPIFNSQLRSDSKSARVSSTAIEFTARTSRVGITTTSQLDTIFEYYKDAHSLPNLKWPIKGVGNRHELLKYLSLASDRIVSSKMSRSSLCDELDRELGIRFSDGMVQSAARDIGIVWRDGKAIRRSQVTSKIKTFVSAPTKQWEVQVKTSESGAVTANITPVLSPAEMTSYLNVLRDSVLRQLDNMDSLITILTNTQQKVTSIENFLSRTNNDFNAYPDHPPAPEVETLEQVQSAPEVVTPAPVATVPVVPAAELPSSNPVTNTGNPIADALNRFKFDVAEPAPTNAMTVSMAMPEPANKIAVDMTNPAPNPIRDSVDVDHTDMMVNTISSEERSYAGWHGGGGGNYYNNDQYRYN